jgi:hypothetical protein
MESATTTATTEVRTVFWTKHIPRNFKGDIAEIKGVKASKCRNCYAYGTVCRDVSHTDDLCVATTMSFEEYKEQVPEPTTWKVFEAETAPHYEKWTRSLPVEEKKADKEEDAEWERDRARAKELEEEEDEDEPELCSHGFYVDLKHGYATACEECEENLHR